MDIARFTLGTSVSILTSMITPVILILAASSVVGATTARLMRIMESMHELSDSFERHVGREQVHDMLADEQMSLMVQIARTTRRVRLLQVSVALQHIAITAFVLTSITLGVEAAGAVQLGVTPVLIGLIGALLLLASMIILVYDAFIAIAATREEASFTLRMTEYQAAEARHNPVASSRSPIAWS